MLPNNDVVREVYMGENGIFEAVQPGSFLIDSSTVDPNVSTGVAMAATGKLILNLPRIYAPIFYLTIQAMIDSLISRYFPSHITKQKERQLL